MSLKAFETDLCKIEDKLTRKQIYLMLFQMVRYDNIPGSQAMKIISQNLKEETAEDILALVLQSLVPIIISKYLPETTSDSVK